MKTKILLTLFLMMFTSQISFSSDQELTVINRSNETLKFVVYPIGAIFNGTKKYDLACITSSGNYIYIYGGEKSGITLNQDYKLDQDGATGVVGDDAIGFGKYRVVFYKLNSGYDSVNYCDVDFSDADYPYTGHQYLIDDLTLEYNSSTDITYYFGGGEVAIPGSKLIVSWDQRTSGNTNSYKTQNKNGFISSTDYPNWPINAADQGAVNHTYLNEVYLNLFLRDNGINLVSNKTMTFRNANFTIKDTTTFKFNSGSSLSFDFGSRFRVFQTYGYKTILVGNNAAINMMEGSSINLNKILFDLDGGASGWGGIRLTNTLYDTVKACWIKGADTCVSLYNSDKCRARVQKVFTGNIFQSGRVFLRNVFQCIIFENEFQVGDQPYGLVIANNVHPNDFVACDEEDSPTPFKLNIVENEFYGGVVQLLINCLTSDLTPFYISNNEFQGTGIIGPRWCVVTHKAFVDFQDNTFTRELYDYSIQAYDSELNILRNVLDGSSLNVELVTSSTAVMAPFYSNGQYYWYGGINTLYSRYQNIAFQSGNEVFINNGSNCFNLEAWDLMFM